MLQTPGEEHYINIQNPNKEHNLYPTNTYAPPSHVPGRRNVGHSHGLNDPPPPYQPPSIDYSAYDIVKVSAAISYCFVNMYLHMFCVCDAIINFKKKTLVVCNIGPTLG